MRKITKYLSGNRLVLTLITASTCQIVYSQPRQNCGGGGGPSGSLWWTKYLRSCWTKLTLGRNSQVTPLMLAEGEKKRSSKPSWICVYICAAWRCEKVRRSAFCCVTTAATDLVQGRQLLPTREDHITSSWTGSSDATPRTTITWTSTNSCANRVNNAGHLNTRWQKFISYLTENVTFLPHRDKRIHKRIPIVYAKDHDKPKHSEQHAALNVKSYNLNYLIMTHI